MWNAEISSKKHTIEVRSVQTKSTEIVPYITTT